MTPLIPSLRLAPRAGKVAVIGANSNLGRRIVLALGTDAVAIARFELPAAFSVPTILVSDYSTIPTKALDGCMAVVNCVGISSGTREMMSRVNVDVSDRVVRVVERAGISRLVHISSFSVYGRAEHIDGSTLEVPFDAYGESKLKADRALLSNTAMDVAILRLPAIVGQHVPSKLAHLIKIWRKLPFLPVPQIAKRSMISISSAAAAACVLAKAEGPVGGKWLVADPVPVNLIEFVHLTKKMKRGRLRAFVLPDMVAGVLRKVLPSVFGKLYGSSVLTTAANAYCTLGLTAELKEEIRQMIKE